MWGTGSWALGMSGASSGLLWVCVLVWRGLVRSAKLWILLGGLLVLEACLMVGAVWA